MSTLPEPDHRADPARAGGQGEHADAGFFRAVRERLISLGTMNRRLRLITGLAIAQLLVAAIMVAARDLPMPSTQLFTPTLDGPRVTVIPIPLLVLSTFLLALAVTYILAGLLHAHWSLSLLGLAALTGFGALDAQNGSGLFNWWGAVVLAVCLWALAGITVLRERRLGAGGGLARSHRHRIDAVTFLGALTIVAATYGLSALRLQGRTGVLAFGSGYALQLSNIAYLVTPMLVLAGSDFGDFASIAGTRISLLLARWRAPLVAALTALAAALVLGFSLLEVSGGALRPTHRVSLIGIGFGCVFVAVAAAVAMAPRLRGRPIAQVPVAAVAAGAVACELIFQVGVPALLAGKSTAPAPQQPADVNVVYQHTASPTFSLRHPPGWQVTVTHEESANSLLGVTFDGSTSGAPVLFLVLALPEAAITPAEAVRGVVGKGTADDPYTFSQPTREGPWATTEFFSRAYHGAGWARVANGRLWVLLSQVFPASRFQAERPLLLAIRDSWSASTGSASGSGSPPATERGGAGPEANSAGPTEGQRLVGIAAITWLCLGLIAIGVLLVAGQRLGRGAAAAAIFTVLTGAWFFLTQVGDLVALSGRAPDPEAPHLTLTTLQCVVAAVTILTVAWLVFRRRLRSNTGNLLLLLALNAGLQFIAWIFALYTGAQGFSQRAGIAQAVVILIALLWDVAMSGEAITNREGRRIPRHSRVLMYLGYILLVTAALVFFTALTLPGGTRIEPAFDSELSAQLGVGVLGVPLVATLSLLALRLRTVAKVPEPTVPDPEP